MLTGGGKLFVYSIFVSCQLIMTHSRYVQYNRVNGLEDASVIADASVSTVDWIHAWKKKKDYEIGVRCRSGPYVRSPASRPLVGPTQLII
jgi:hypothetical protein